MDRAEEIVRQYHEEPNVWLTAQKLKDEPSVVRRRVLDLLCIEEDAIGWLLTNTEDEE